MININSKNICENCFESTKTLLCPHCGYENGITQNDARLLAPGSILSGKYIVGKPLGVGGFGVTYLGYDAVQDKIVAIKEYFPQGFAIRSSDSVTVSVSEENLESHNSGKEKFYEEAKLVSRFNGNPNIVGVYEFFYENNTAYFIMEHLDGMDLKHYIKHKGGKISSEETLTILNDVSSALMVIHSANVLHRDIAPDNIFLCKNGNIKLIDFGAARQYSGEQSKNLSVILKQGFAPLEQYQKRGKQGPWTDIYALGATAYYALTGELLDDPMSRLEEDTLADSETPGIDDNLYTIIKKCVKLTIQERYPNTFELKNDLNSLTLTPAPISVAQYMPQVTVPEPEPTSEEAVPDSPEPVPPLSKIMTFAKTERKTKAKKNNKANQISISKSAVSLPLEPEKKKINIGAIIGGIAATVTIAAIIIAAVVINPGDNDIPINTTTTRDPFEGITYADEVGKDNEDNGELPAINQEKVTTPSQTSKETEKNNPSQTPKETEKNNPSQTPKVTEKTTPTPPVSQSITIGGVTIKAGQEVIDLSNRSLTNSDITKLSELTNPKEIIINNNPKITDLSCLSKLTSLEKLTFNCCSVKDISFLKNLKKLKVLGAEENGISNISVLSNLIELEEVWLQNNSIANISALRNCTKVKYLNLKNSKVKDTSPISVMDNLVYIDLTNNGATDLSFAKNKTKLKEAYLSNNRFNDVRPLKNCNALTHLYLDGSTINDDTIFYKKVNMIELSISNCSHYDVHSIADMTELTYLNLSNNYITDLTPLANCKKLTYLNANSNLLDGNLDALKGITVVGDIYVEENDYNKNSADEIYEYVNTYMYGPFTIHY